MEDKGGIGMPAFARWTRRVGFVAAMLMAPTVVTEARSPAAGDGVPAIVSRALPAVVSITTRQIE